MKMKNIFILCLTISVSPFSFVPPSFNGMPAFVTVSPDTEMCEFVALDFEPFEYEVL